LIGVAAGAAGVQVWARFAADLRAQRARVARGSRVWTSPRFGPIEYAMVGRGVPVLLAHGAGGGFDQVTPAAERLAVAGYQVVAPSRFGYLRSSSPDDPSPLNQAEAFVALMDRLQIRRAAVVGISAGALSALQLALAHP
jgi:pimeloyl-ACP methyl ester carboxylesterase